MRREELIAQAHALRLDVLAVEACEVLRDAGIECVVIKGVTTALWLYSPPRGYIDVDILVPPIAVAAAVTALSERGVAYVAAGEVGEEAEHSVMLRSARGEPLDLHRSLPMLGPSSHRDAALVWSTLRPHIEAFSLGASGSIPALDVPARVVVLALHACNSGADDARVREDLARAHDQVSTAEWSAATRLAAVLGIGDLFDAGWAIASGSPLDVTAPADVRLRVMGASSTSLGVYRMLHAPRRDLPRLILRELFPTRGFMIEAYGEGPLARHYVSRLTGHARDLPRVVRELRAARRSG